MHVCLRVWHVHEDKGENVHRGYKGPVPNASWNLFPPVPPLSAAALENLPFHCWLKVIKNIVASTIAVERNPYHMALQTSLENI